VLEACAARRCSNLVSLKVEPDLDVLHADPRFQNLLPKSGHASPIRGPRTADRGLRTADCGLRTAEHTFH
jgi:hypothetical protein